LPLEPALGDLEALKAAYQQIPPLVLADLALFINPHELSFVTDDPSGRLSAYNEGLRAVWIHVTKRREQLPELIATLRGNEDERTEPADRDTPGDGTAERSVADAAEPPEYDPFSYTADPD